MRSTANLCAVHRKTGMNSHTTTRNQVNLGTGYGWTNKALADEAIIHFKGYLNQESNGDDAMISIATALRAAREGKFERIRATDGHFACVLEESSSVVVAVDRVRSIPLLLAPLPGGGWIIADHAEPIVKTL